MAITALLTVPAQPGQGDALVAAFQDLLPDTRSYQGCLGVTVHQRADDKDTVLLIEHWESAADHQSYSEWRRDGGTLGPVMALAGGRPDVQLFSDAD